MTLLCKLALRNIFRNKRRTGLTLTAIVCGSVALILFGGFIQANYQGLRESTINSRLGHIQIFQAGFQENRARAPEKFLLSPQSIKKINLILEEISGVEIVTARLEFSGLLSNGRTSIAVIGIGGEVEKEAEMSVGLTLIDGESLFEDDEDEVLMGKGLAASLHARPGDVLTLLASTSDGAINAVDVVVAGIFESFSNEYDERAMRMNLQHTESFSNEYDKRMRMNLQHTRFLLDNEGVTNMVVLLDETARTEAVAKQLAILFQQAELQVEIKTWSELAPFYHAVVRLYDGLFGFLQLIVMVIVFLGIANTMTMSVMERTPEIGTIRALGTRKKGVVALILLEGTLLGALGGVIGILLGVVTARLVTAGQFMMPPPPGSSIGFPIIIRIVPSVLAVGFLLAAGAALLSSIYPALKAARLKIVDALRFT